MKYQRKEKFKKLETPSDILQVALEKEKSSYEFYKQQAKIAKFSAMSSLFKKLEKVELDHVRMIKKLLDK